MPYATFFISSSLCVCGGIYIKKEFVVFMIFLALVQGAYGISLSVSTSCGQTTSSAKTSGAVNFGDAFQQTIQVIPVGLLASASSGTGSMPEQVHSVWSADNRNYADVRAKVVGSSSTTWSYDWKTSQSSTANQWVIAEEWLSASNAYSINLNGWAFNSEGDSVQSTTEVVKGSLSGYYVKAAATPTYASISQKANSASGYSIEVRDSAYNAEKDNVQSDIQIKSGTISMSSPTIPGFSTSAIAKGTSAQVNILNLKASAPSGWISQRLSAQNAFDSSSASLGIDKGYLFNYPYSKSYPSVAYASGYSDKTYALQSTYMQGATVKSDAYSYIYNPVTNPPSKDKSTLNTNAKVKVVNYAWTSSTGYDARATYLV